MFFTKRQLLTTATCVVVLAVCSTTTVWGQSTAAPVCASTGPICLHENCTGVPNGNYQWCGGCDVYLRCLNQVAAFFSWVNPAYAIWDDNKKNFEATSTTCNGCYFECPPGSSIPPPESGVCTKTGPNCVDGLSFCTNLLSNKRLQYCGSCKSYVNCSTGGGSAMVNCPEGTFFDVTANDCIASSTSCVECYTPCSEFVPTTAGPTTIEVTTDEDTTGGTEDPLNTTAGAGSTSHQSTTGRSVRFTVSTSIVILSLIWTRFVSTL